MTTTLLALLQKVSENLGDYESGTFTTSSASVPADTAQAHRVDDTFNERWLMPTAGTYVKVESLLQDFTKTGGVFTPYTAFAGATGTVAYIVSRHKPSDMISFINRAVADVYPTLWVPHIDEFSLITNNILPNSAFQDWASSSVPDKWDISVGLLVAAKYTTAATQLIREGTSSMKLSGGNTQYLSCRTWDNRYLNDLSGKTVTFKVWAWYSAASALRIACYTGSSASYSSYHSGDSNWHLLSKSADFLADPTTNPQFWIEHTAVDSFYSYISSARVIGQTVQRYLLPTSFKELQQVWIQTAGNVSFSADSGLAMCDSIHEGTAFEKLFNWRVEPDGTDKWLIFPYSLPDERRLKLVGSKYGSSMTALTDTVEFNSPQTNMIAALAAYYVADAESKVVEGADNSAKYREIADRNYDDYLKLKNQHSTIPMPATSIRYAEW